MDFANMDRRQMTMAASGFSVMLTMHFTFQLLSQHLFYWKKPREQKAIAVIILIAPLYAFNSFAGISGLGERKPFILLLNSIKECYDALVIAQFLALLYSYLNISMSNNVVLPDEIKGKEIHFSFPMTLFQPSKTHLSRQTLKVLKKMTWQFVLIRPVCSILMITLPIIGMYPSWINWVFSIILRLSFFIVMYSLVVFYHVFAKELEPHKPQAKFICITGIIFFCFWQGVVLDILVSMDIIKSHQLWFESKHAEEVVHNILVSVEMLIFSVFQQYAFHVAPYSGDVEPKFRMQKRD